MRNARNITTRTTMQRVCSIGAMWTIRVMGIFLAAGTADAVLPTLQTNGYCTDGTWPPGATCLSDPDACKLALCYPMYPPFPCNGGVCSLSSRIFHPAVGCATDVSLPLPWASLRSRSATGDASVILTKEVSTTEHAPGVLLTANATTTTRKRARWPSFTCAGRKHGPARSTMA